MINAEEVKTVKEIKIAKEHQEALSKFRETVKQTGVIDFNSIFGLFNIMELDDLILLFEDLLKNSVHTVIVDFEHRKIGSDFSGFVDENNQFLNDFISTLKNTKMLTRLDMSNFRFFREGTVKHFLEVLSGTAISELRLHNWVSFVKDKNGKEMEALSLFSEADCIQKLSSFDISYNRHNTGTTLSPEKYQALLNLLQKANFRSCNLSGQEVSREQESTFSSISISELMKPKPVDRRVEDLVETISKMTQLEELDLSNTALRSKNLKSIVESLQKRNLKVLNLSNNYFHLISCEESDPLYKPVTSVPPVEELKPLLEKRTLTRLGFAEHAIGVQGFRFLYPYLKGASAITQVDLQRNKIELTKIKKEMGELRSNSSLKELGIVDHKRFTKKESEIITQLLKDNFSLCVFPLGTDDNAFFHINYENVRILSDCIRDNFCLTSVKHPFCNAEDRSAYLNITGKVTEHPYLFGKMINFSIDRNQRLQYQFFKLTSECLGTHLPNKNVAKIILRYLDIDLNYLGLFIEYAYLPCTEAAYKSNEERLIARLKDLHKEDNKKVQAEAEAERQAHQNSGFYRRPERRGPIFLPDDIIQALEPRRLGEPQ